MSDASSFANRRLRLSRLRDATRQYVDKEQKELLRQADVLTKILKGRTGGRGADKSVIAKANAVSEHDLATFLNGATGE